MEYGKGYTMNPVFLKRSRDSHKRYVLDKLHNLILDMQEEVEKREKAPTHILASDRRKLARKVYEWYKNE